MVRPWTVALLVLLTGRRPFGVGWPQVSHGGQLLLATEDVNATDVAPIGCYYKGRSYDPGTLVSTDQPCLKCTCVTGSLVCHLQVCPEMPDPPPQGCVVVHKKTKCCAQLRCDYEQFGPVITKLYPSQTNSRSGPARVENSAIVTYDGLHKGCVVNGTVYAEGSAMDSSSLCEYCYCIKGRQQCVRPHCSMNIPGCAAVYKKHTCCPIRYKCSPQNPLIENTTNAPTTTETASSLYARFKDCRINGRLISLGEPVIGVARSSCETCFCINGQVRCDKVICPPIRAQISPNCGPVYTEGHCCPTSYDCADATDATTPGNDRETPLVGGAAASAPTTTTTTTAKKTTTTTSPTTAVQDDNVHHHLGSPPPTTTAIPTTETESTSSASNSRTTTTTAAAEDPMESRHANPAGVAPDRFGGGGGLNATEKSNSLLTDYDELTLPPSLPNLKIIPFVAADAVLDEPAPVYDSYQPVVERVYNVSDIIAEEQQPPSLVINSFSPPVETEGGFVPKDSPAGTVYNNVPNKIRTSTERVQSTTDLRAPYVTENQPIGPGPCAANGKKYKHGELLTEPSACDICVCFDAKIVCQKNCPAVRVGCQRIADPDNGTCCGRIVCDETEKNSTADDREAAETTTAHAASESRPLTATNTADSVIEHVVYSAAPTQRPVAAPSTPSTTAIIPSTTAFIPTASAAESTGKPTVATAAEPATPEPTTAPPRPAPADEDYSFESMFSFLFSGDAASEQPSSSAPPPPAAVTDNRAEHRTDDETDDEAAGPAQSGFESLVEQMFGTAAPDSDAPHHALAVPERRVDVAENSDDGRRTAVGSQRRPNATAVPGVKHDNGSPPHQSAGSERPQLELSGPAIVVHQQQQQKQHQQPQEQHRQPQRQPEHHQHQQPQEQHRQPQRQPEHHQHHQQPQEQHRQPQRQPEHHQHQQPQEQHRQPQRQPEHHHHQQQQRRRPQTESTPADAVVEPSSKVGVQPVQLAPALKISGCNVYGRMYRAGEIVPELSTPCLECMCTDVGVHCSPLKC